MKKGEIWISNFWDGRNGVVIGDKVGPNLWNCIYLIQIEGKKYAKDCGGRVTGNPLDDSYYTGEGQVVEDVFTQFYHVEEGVEIVPMPEMPSSSSDGSLTFSNNDASSYTWMIYQENNS